MVRTWHGRRFACCAGHCTVTQFPLSRQAHPQVRIPTCFNHWLVPPRRLRLGPEDVFLQKIPISFDPSVQVRLRMPRNCLLDADGKASVCSTLMEHGFPQELFSPLACGGKLVLAAPGGEKDTQYLAQLIAAQGVTFCIYVPSQLDASLQVRHGPRHCCAAAACVALLRQQVLEPPDCQLFLLQLVAAVMHAAAGNSRMWLPYAILRHDAPCTRSVDCAIHGAWC